MPPGSAETPPRKPSRVFVVPAGVKCLDTLQLAGLEKAFRTWAGAPVRRDVRASRKRMLLAFLLLRFTGAKPGEVLDLEPARDLEGDAVRLGRDDRGGEAGRSVSIPAELARDLAAALADPDLAVYLPRLFDVDQGHLRRKFYERADEAGLPRDLVNPTVLRRSRAIELLREGLPLPMVQKVLGHSTANLAAGYLDVSDADLQQVLSHFVAAEARRTSSARNAFYGRVDRVERGDIQARVELETLGGHRIATVITLDSLQSLALRPGSFATAEIKAPWVILTCEGARDGQPPRCSAENRLAGAVEAVRRGRINAEVILRLADDTRLCAIVTTPSLDALDLAPGAAAWALFSAFAVILRVE
ncbi:MAG: TOBE domain-containing protein [Thermodesulfobacteriota bacterium]